MLRVFSWCSLMFLVWTRLEKCLVQIETSISRNWLNVILSEESYSIYHCSLKKITHYTKALKYLLTFHHKYIICVILLLWWFIIHISWNSLFKCHIHVCVIEHDTLEKWWIRKNTTWLMLEWLILESQILVVEVSHLF